MQKLHTQFTIQEFGPTKWSDQTGIHCKDKTLAQQQFKDECDINVLYARYLETGEMPQLQNGDLAYGDFTGVFDYTTAMNFIRDAQEKFAQLPARIKNRFDNDPQKLVHFLNDPENREEADFLGLTNRRVEGEPNEPHSEKTPLNRENPPAQPAGTQGDQATTPGSKKP